MFNLLNNKFCIPVLLCSLLILSCKSEKKQLHNTISELEALIYDENYTINKLKAAELISAYGAYAEKFSDDTLSATYLFDSANLSGRMGNYSQSINLFTKVYSLYPNFKERGIVLFRMAFDSDQIKQYENAIKYYKLFIENYPNHEFADDAAVLLQRVGQSDDEFFNDLAAKEKLNSN